MPYFRKIIGKRLYLSPFDPGDEEIDTKWARWMNDKTVSDYFGGHRDLVSVERARNTLAQLRGYRFAIVLLENDELIGHVSLHDVEHIDRNAFLGIFIGEQKHRNKGYGEEALRLVLDYGFNTLNLNNIMLSVHTDNTAAISCYKKVGFREVGRRREWVFKNGKYVDKLYMDMLAREFTGPIDETL